VFAKKGLPRTMTEACWFTEIMSFTKMDMTAIRIAQKYLCAGDRVLIVDDFLAHGQAAAGLVKLVEQADAELLGIGIVIEKAFQGGGALLREQGIRIESLAVISEIANGEIHFQ
jgi:xanthine phosphoribosyltransferase